VVEFVDIIGPLTDPARYGGDPAELAGLLVRDVREFFRQVR
jgi:hypothetical protein